MTIIDLNTKTMIQNKKVLISNGIPINDSVISKTPISISDLENLYAEYKRSVPTNTRYQYHFFKALPVEQLSKNDLQKGTNRDIAKTNLETAVLMGSLNGSLVWEDDTKWFWQSTNDKDFILLKQWVK